MWEEEKAKEFLGVGWKFPVQVDEHTGRIKTSSYEEDIQEAIKIILMTRKGERVMQPDFGCNLQNYVYETMAYSNIVQIQQEIKRALTIWEPRIIEVDVSVGTEHMNEGKVEIAISYTVRTTNNPYNLVYPYYLNEGM